MIKYKGKILTAEQEDHVNTIVNSENLIDITKFKNFNHAKQRFFKKISKESLLPENKDNCWKWCGTKKARGYGEFWWGYEAYKAHRMSYIIHHGPIPPGKIVRHTCDNPSCVNPRHLLLGTASDNMIDCIKRNRHNTAILNEEAVKVIKWFLKYKYYPGLIKKLADVHGVSKNVIQKIKLNRRWTWVKIN